MCAQAAWQLAPPSCFKRWAEAHEKIARMTLTIKLDRNWSSFQLANSAPPLSVTDSAIAPSARMKQLGLAWASKGAMGAPYRWTCAGRWVWLGLRSGLVFTTKNNRSGRGGARVSELARNGGKRRGCPNWSATGKAALGGLAQVTISVANYNRR